MKVTIFTSNQPRHISLIESFSKIADQVFVVQECNTVFPGKVADFFRNSAIMQEYFSHVIEAERTVFGIPRFTPANSNNLVIKAGDLNQLSLVSLEPALQSDIYIIFGSSYIKGKLCDHLVNNKAINIHMGISPYYRGSSCNFWALYDKRPHYVGATIHRLSPGLDSGEMLFHAIPKPQAVDPFLLGMLSVKTAHEALIEHIQKGDIWSIEPIPQDKRLELRYTRNKDFTDEIAEEYLKNMPTKNQIKQALETRDLRDFVNPFQS